MEKTVTLTEDEVAMLGDIWYEVVNHISSFREWRKSKEGKNAMNLLERLADPYQ